MSKESEARKRWLELARQADELRNQERETLRALIQESLGDDAPLEIADIQPIPQGGWQVIIRPRGLAPLDRIPPVTSAAPEFKAPATPQVPEHGRRGRKDAPLAEAPSESVQAPKPEQAARAEPPKAAPASRKPAEEEVSLPLPPLPLIEETDVLDLPGAPFPPLTPEPHPDASSGRSTGMKREDAPLPAPPTLDSLPPIPVTPAQAAPKTRPEPAGKTEKTPTPVPPALPVLDSLDGEPAAPSPKKSEKTAPPAGPRTLAELLESGDADLRVPATERKANPYLNASIDPQSRAERLARTLVGDIVAYKVDEHKRALSEGPDRLKTEFGEDIDAARAEFLRQVDPDQVDVDQIFQTALNEVIAHGQQVF